LVKLQAVFNTSVTQQTGNAASSAHILQQSVATTITDFVRQGE